MASISGVKSLLFLSSLILVNPISQAESTMDFNMSTQAKSWTFDEESLSACKQRAVATEVESSTGIAGRVRKFASGFHRQYQQNHSEVEKKSACTTEISCRDQEILVQFHAHQIQFLVGPTAILTDLRTSETVLSTAITFFRRFYLSNSIVEVSPRKISAACAFFAAKVEDEKVEIGLISHATALVQRRVYNAPLCCRELRSVPVAEIEYAERLIMEGLNYEFRCHHVGSTIDILFSDSLLSCTPDKSRARGDLSPRASVEYRDEKAFLWRKALDIAQRALIFSDAHFLFNPCHTAFAVTAIAIGSVTVEGNMSGKLQKYVAKLFPTKTKAELDDFSQSVGDIIHMLVNCPSLDLRPGCGHASEIIIERAEELRRVLGEVATIRLLRKMKRFQSWPCKSRKRSRFELDFTPPRQLQTRKYAKITPI